MAHKVWVRRSKMTDDEIRSLGLGAHIWVEYELNGKRHVEGHRVIIGASKHGCDARVYGPDDRDFVYLGDPSAPDSEGGINHIYHTEEVDVREMDTPELILKRIEHAFAFCEDEGVIWCDRHRFVERDDGVEMEVTEFDQTKRFVIRVEEIE